MHMHFNFVICFDYEISTFMVYGFCGQMQTSAQNDLSGGFHGGQTCLSNGKKGCVVVEAEYLRPVWAEPCKWYFLACCLYSE